MRTAFSMILTLATLIVASVAGSQLFADPQADDDVPVAEDPAEEPAEPEKKAPLAAEDDDEILKAVEALKDAAEQVDRIEEAIEGMRTAQKRIADADTSSATQKIQEGVVKDLEDLLALLKKQQQNQQNNPQQNPNQNPNRDQKNPRQQMKKGTADPQNSDPKTSRRNDDKSRDAEERTDAARAKAAEQARREQMLKDVWGHLPPHLREAMRNALRENYLPKYDDLVKKYYEALAEKNRKRTGK